MLSTTSDFFPMFNVPFRYGRAWTPQDDERRARVAVISSRLNDSCSAVPTAWADTAAEGQRCAHRRRAGAVASVAAVLRRARRTLRPGRDRRLLRPSGGRLHAVPAARLDIKPADSGSSPAGAAERGDLQTRRAPG